MRVELIAIQPGEIDKAELVERAARICYRSEMSRTADERMVFLGKLANRGHLSVFEHARYIMRFANDPYRCFWRIRYGVSITDSLRGFIISFNARNMCDFDVGNPVLAPETCTDNITAKYSELTPGQKLAHASATFEISGISRACSHQLVRHRVMSFSQESQRYCDGGEWEPVVPPSAQGDHPCSMGPSPCTDILSARDVFDSSMVTAKETYRWLRELNVSKQDARFILPNATPTRLMVTATFEHWRHFLKLRLHKSAQWEIRAVAGKILEQLIEVDAEIFGDLIVQTLQEVEK